VSSVYRNIEQLPYGCFISLMLQRHMIVFRLKVMLLFKTGQLSYDGYP